MVTKGKFAIFSISVAHKKIKQTKPMLKAIQFSGRKTKSFDGKKRKYNVHFVFYMKNIVSEKSTWKSVLLKTAGNDYVKHG